MKQRLAQSCRFQILPSARPADAMACTLLSLYDASSTAVEKWPSAVSDTELKQRLAAILAADVAGYSRLMSLDDRATVAALDTARQVFRVHIESNHGRVIDMAGDSVLAVFDSAAGAVSAALAVQAELGTLGADLPEASRMRFRIGIHLGDVIEKADGTVYGDGVNIAARLEGLAEPGGVTVSESIRTAVKGKVNADFMDQGDRQVKNIADPVRAYAVKAGIDTLLAATGVDVSQPVAGFGSRPAIAVLPFANLTGDPDQEYFADGLAEDILTRLAMQRWLPVIARNSSFAYRGRTVDVKTVGRMLGARYVLEGSVRKSGNRVRVTGQLIDATTGHHVWAERYDRVLEDLFAIQDELTDGIVGALEAAAMRVEGERARRKPPSNLDAWDAGVRGWWHFKQFTREDFAAAMPLFHQSLELDATQAGPHAGIAMVRLCEVAFLWAEKPQDALAEALTSARAALAADPLESMAYAALGFVLAVTGKPDEALAMCSKGIELNPSLAFGYHALCFTRLCLGEPQAAIKAIETAIRISPNDVVLHVWLSLLSTGHYMARNYEKAAEVASLAVQRGPSYSVGWRSLANALGQLGRLDEAREALEQFLARMPGFTSEQAARSVLSFRDEAVFQHWLEGLRKAGWKG
ncbi:adenylate/guanylate cyclase domain-containing protein [Variovorax sp. J22R24]|uniref:adenylate/guanylate cyclase domain-containing protein n=1 Tax=Variovorax gracilis TaxID=3053502 RepID=UPI0025787037|nr:adenylate/guanylate cyclase domain-containing protein [Variovorax sp. J22R24]MDM0109711.1 adenylate/guanylate cyclase domain-containing protein [Variovorax sp. J22R24]